jgi:hypothetical protein
MEEPSVHYYIHPASIGDFAACKQVFSQRGDEIQQLYNERQIDGYQVVIIRTAEEAEDQYIWCQYDQVTGGRYPFLCAIIQPLAEPALAIDEQLAEWSFVRCEAIP